VKAVCTHHVDKQQLLEDITNTS